MIIGLGSDLCNIERIESVLARHGDRFRKRVFTETELALAARRKLEAATQQRMSGLMAGMRLPPGMKLPF